MIKEIEFNVSPEELVNVDKFKTIIAKKSGIKEDSIANFEVLRKSIDARKKPVNYRIKVAVDIIEKVEQELEGISVIREQETKERKKDVRNAKSVIVIGAGPAGLFASLKLIEKGLKPIILERGKSVSERKKDTAQIIRQQEINPE
jgi:uncharacterized protein